MVRGYEPGREDHESDSRSGNFFLVKFPKQRQISHLHYQVHAHYKQIERTCAYYRRVSSGAEVAECQQDTYTLNPPHEIHTLVPFLLCLLTPSFPFLSNLLACGSQRQISDGPRKMFLSIVLFNKRTQ